MTAALFTKSSVSWRCLDLLDDEPIVVRPAGRVDAIPVFQHDAPETLRHECLAPRAQPAGHVRREADIPGLREDALEVTPSLEERDLEERLAVDLEEIERGEDAPPSGRSRERIALLVHLEVRLVAPVVDQHAVDDRAVTPRVGDDRVVELARGLELAHVPAEAGPARVPDTYEGARSHPLRLQDVALRFRALADEAWSLRCQVGSEERRHIPSTSLIVRPLTARTFVLSCPNVRSNGRPEKTTTRCSMAAASALTLRARPTENVPPSPSRHVPVASAARRVPPRVYSPFRARPRPAPMAVPAPPEEAAVTPPGRAWRRLFRR